MGYVWSDNHLELVVKWMATGLLSEYVRLALYTRTSISIFESLPFRYRFKFIEGILGVVEGIRDEKVQEISEKIGEADLEESKEWKSIWNFNEVIMHAFCQRPYSLYFFVYLMEYEIPSDWNEDNVENFEKYMLQAFKNLTKDDYALYARYHSSGAKDLISYADSIKDAKDTREILGKDFAKNLKGVLKREMKGELVVENEYTERERAYVVDNINNI